MRGLPLANRSTNRRPLNNQRRALPCYYRDKCQCLIGSESFHFGTL